MLYASSSPLKWLSLKENDKFKYFSRPKSDFFKKTKYTRLMWVWKNLFYGSASTYMAFVGNIGLKGHEIHCSPLKAHLNIAQI